MNNTKTRMIKLTIYMYRYSMDILFDDYYTKSINFNLSLGKYVKREPISELRRLGLIMVGLYIVRQSEDIVNYQLAS